MADEATIISIDDYIVSKLPKDEPYFLLTFPADGKEPFRHATNAKPEDVIKHLRHAADVIEKHGYIRIQPAPAKARAS